MARCGDEMYGNVAGGVLLVPDGEMAGVATTESILTAAVDPTEF